MVRGDPDTGRFAVFYFVGGRLVACDAINSPVAFNVAKRIIGRADIAVDERRIADADFDLRELLAATAA